MAHPVKNTCNDSVLFPNPPCPSSKKWQRIALLSGAALVTAIAVTALVLTFFCPPVAATVAFGAGALFGAKIGFGIVGIIALVTAVRTGLICLMCKWRAQAQNQDLPREERRNYSKKFMWGARFVFPFIYRKIRSKVDRLIQEDTQRMRDWLVSNNNQVRPL